MAKSQNGWPVVKTGLTSLPQVTGKVLTGPTWVVFYWLCQYFHRTVEPITKTWSWGWSYRRISGSAKWSNHASGTAIDLNAPKHPAGKTNTFTNTQEAQIALILKAARGVIRWGRLFRDEMHFEIAPGITHAQVQQLATVILQVALSDAGHDPGPPDGIRGPRTKAALLAFQTAHKLTPDGLDGPKTWAALTAAQPKENAA
jgi:hypothetical protein